MSFKQLLEDVAKTVTEYILGRVKGEPPEIYDAALHLIRAGGKRLRPFIVVSVAAGLGAEVEKALPFAAAVEMVHNFTLIHDDIIDRDEFRRGVPTVHKLWGEALAITAGDLLFAKAFEVIHDAASRGVPYENIARASHVLAKYSAIVAEGQAMDIMFEDREDVSIDEYLKMVYKKTGALFEASALLGGLVVTTDEKVLNPLGDFGRNLGVAFQIRDDILGLVGDEKVLGKPVYSDLREGKKTVLVIYALSKLEGSRREKLLSVLGKRDASRDELEEAARIIIDTGAVEYAQRLLGEYLELARSALERVKLSSPWRDALLELVEFVGKRSY